MTDNGLLTDDIKQLIEKEAEYYAHKIVVPITGNPSTPYEMNAIRKYKAEFALFADHLLSKLQPLLAAKENAIEMLKGVIRDQDNKMKRDDAEIAQLKAQADEYKRQSTLTYCVYCGATFPLDNEAGAKVTEHIKTCEKHPLFIANAEIERLKGEVARLNSWLKAPLKSLDITDALSKQAGEIFDFIETKFADSITKGVMTATNTYQQRKARYLRPGKATQKDGE